MKKLIFIAGTMGVGKTSVSKKLLSYLPKAVFLDGDWCWMMNPFVVNEKTKKMVEENICFLLNQFLHQEEYQNILFCWVMHYNEIVDSVLSKLDLSNVEVVQINLMASNEKLTERITKDFKNQLRDENSLSKALAYQSLYKNKAGIHLDTSDLTIDEVTKEIIEILEENHENKF
jgi:broad-specificity NMP kinase